MRTLLSSDGSSRHRVTRAAGALAMLLAAAPLGCGGDSTSCGAGTVDSNGTCVVAPAAASFSDIAVTHLVVPYDESRPVFVGHRLPVRLGITSRAPTPLAAPQSVTVNLSLVEHAEGTPPAARLATLRQCFVKTLELDLNGTGEEQLFEPTVEIPPECLPTGTESVTYNFIVQVDPTQRALPASAGRAYYFTEAQHAAAGADERCRSSLDMGAPLDGCVHRLQVRASPGTDVAAQVTPEGHVGLFWMNTVGTESRREMLSVQVDRRAWGHDPYDVGGADSDRLPGMVTERVRIAPATGSHAGEFRPLRVEAARAEDPPTETRTFDRLTPAADNRQELDLFPTDEVLALVRNGDWRDVDDFTIEVCLDPSFEERGEDGATLSTGEEGTTARSARSDDCRRFSVLGVRALAGAAQTSASRLDFNREWSRHYGNDKLGLDLRFNTENFLVVGGAVSDTSARAALDSKYLPDLTLAEAKAYAGVDLFAADRTGLTFNVDVFGIRLLGYERRVPEARELYNRDWNIMRRQCKSARVQVGPIPVGLEGCVAGTVGLNVNAGVYRDAAIEMRRFPMADTEGQIAVTVTPYVTIGATASVSLDALIARGGVEGQLTIIDIRTPLTGSANIGLVRNDPMTMRPAAQGNLNINWDLVVTGLSGRIVLFVDTRGVEWCSKKVVFVRVYYPCGIRWDRRGELALFTFGADPERFNLLNRTFADFRLAP